MDQVLLTVAIAQMAPVWLDKKETTLKIIGKIDEAGAKGFELVVFGEGLLPGYPFWIELTNGAVSIQKFRKKSIHIIFNRLFKLKKVTCKLFAILY